MQFYKYYLTFGLVIIMGLSLLGQKNTSTQDNEIVPRRLPDGVSPFSNLAEPPELVIENGTHVEFVQAIKFSPDGKEIITASWDKSIRIWDSLNGKLIRTIRVPAYAGIEGQIFTMDVSPNKKYIAVAGSSVGEAFNTQRENFEGHYVLLIDYKTGKILDTAPDFGQSIYSVNFSPDGKKIAACAGKSDNKVNIYGINSIDNKLILSESHPLTPIADQYFPECEFILDEICDHAALSVRFSPDSKSVYAVDEHGMLVRFILKTSASPAQHVLIGESNGRKNAVMTGKISPKASLWSQAVDPKGRYIAIGDVSGKILLVDAKGLPTNEVQKGTSAEKLLASIPLLKNSPASCLTFDPTGSLLAVAIGSEIRVFEINLEATTTPVVISKPIQVFKGHDNDVLSIAFSPDGKNIVSSGGNYNISYVWEVKTGQIQFQLGEGKYSAKTTSVGAHKNNPHVIGFATELSNHLSINNYGVINKAFDLKNLRVIENPKPSDFITAKSDMDSSNARYPDFNSGWGQSMMSFLPLKNGYTIIGTGSCLFLDNNEKSMDLLTMTGTKAYGLALTPDATTFYSGHSDGLIKIYDVKTLNLVASLYVNTDNEWILFTPDGYYTASKYGAKLVGWQINEGIRKSPKFYPFEQFDLRLNRPDIVLTRIGGVTKKRIDMLFLAYQKRLEKMGISEEFMSNNLNAPTLELDLMATESTQKLLLFNVKANDTQNNLERLNIYINDVPLYGSKGFSLKSKPSKTLEKPIGIELNNGSNKIQVSVLNDVGVESFQETRYVTYRGPAVKPNLYVLAIGVSDYQDSNFDLQFAAKDAIDIATFYEGQSGKFGAVKTLKITDKQATKETIKQAKIFLKESRVEDEVIMFVAGHGLLDSKLDFYFATTDVDFNNPAGRGLKYDELEALIDDIPARKKLLLIDACHSGELDKEAVEISNEAIAANDAGVKSRGFKNIKNNDDLGLSNVFELMRVLFSDLRRGSGAMVISSASGAEFAYESGEWSNGVFTYSYLEGLKTSNADQNKNSEILVSEIRDYVTLRVTQLTKGKQTPTSRRENLEFDFRVW